MTLTPGESSVPENKKNLDKIIEETF